MSGQASLTWFTRHELTLAWRDFAQMMTGGRTRREKAVSIVGILFVAGLHLIAYLVLSNILPGADLGSKHVLVLLGATVLLTFSMMLSQALEQVTRAFYARGDLDLILSSPASSDSIFAVRIAAIALSSWATTGLMVAPIINAAAMVDGAKWLMAYPVIGAFSAVATGFAVLMTLALFRYAGPKRTRLASQIIAAIVGASLLIGLQAAAVIAYGNLSRFSVLMSSAVVTHAPEPSSLFWLPAKALSGDFAGAIILLAGAVLFLSAIIAKFGHSFAGYAIAAAGVSETFGNSSKAQRKFVSRSALGALRHKEWMLLARDPWLLSQSLMQMLYLLPPALLLWRDMGQEAGAVVLLAPVLVMAFGQLSGGLAWLAISGEDAPDLVATAPTTASSILRAKIEAVLAVIAAVSAPFVAAMAFISLWSAAACVTGIALASASAIATQLWFKSNSRRSQFRKRQTATKIATLTEAFSSIFWAAAAGFAAAGSWFALIFVALAVLTLWASWLLSPARQGA